MLATGDANSSASMVDCSVGQAFGAHVHRLTCTCINERQPVLKSCPKLISDMSRYVIRPEGGGRCCGQPKLSEAKL